MKGIKSIIATGSLLTFVVSFAVFVISILAGFYANLALSGLTAVVAFIFYIASGNPDNATYLRHCQRS
jgi:hypothetical protein